MAIAFISYRRETSEEAALLLHDKLDNEFDIFLDRRDGMNDGKFKDILSREIINANHFIILIGSTTWSSEWVKKELRLAL
ncbi:MAG TPA: toll/interleukin-1 receptor domain-containing protein, partial [Aggregatilineales bacterium]|nr:toll/interleukin-1 receptor domain-containing protein [Aggregatilineales bacterium]